MHTPTIKHTPHTPHKFKRTQADTLPPPPHTQRHTFTHTKTHTQTHTHTTHTQTHTHTIATKGLHLIPPSTPYHHHNHRQHQKPHPSGQGVKTFPVMLGREQSIGTFTIIEGLLS